MIRNTGYVRDIDKLVSRLRAKFPDHEDNLIVKLDTGVDFLNDEGKVLLKEAMQAGLLLTKSQFIAYEMGQDLIRELVVIFNNDDPTRAVRDMLNNDYKKQNLTRE